MLSAAITNRSISDFKGSVYQKRSIKGKIEDTRFEDVFAGKDEEEKRIILMM